MTIWYPDVSNHEGAMPLEAGTVAVCAKASEGTTYADPYYQHYKAEAGRVGALFFAYHFLRQGHGAAQARFCHSIVGNGVNVMIDHEPTELSAGVWSLPTVQDALDFAATFRALGGLCTLVYLPRWYWGNPVSDRGLGSPSLAPLAAAGLSLISSNYTGYSDTGPGWAPYGGVAPVIWPYTDALPYSGQSVDFNAFRGTVADLQALLGYTEDDMTPDQANQLEQLYNAVFFGGDSMGATPAGAANNSIVSKADALLAAVGGFTAVPGELVTVEQDIAHLVAPTIDPGAFAAAVKAALQDPAVIAPIASAVVAQIGADLKPSAG